MSELKTHVDEFENTYVDIASYQELEQEVILLRELVKEAHTMFSGYRIRLQFDPEKKGTWFHDWSEKVKKILVKKG